MKKYAFVLMGNYDPARDKAEFTHGESLTRICTVRSFAQAEQTVEALWKEGFGAVEVCGARRRARSGPKAPHTSTAPGRADAASGGHRLRDPRPGAGRAVQRLFRRLSKGCEQICLWTF